MLILFDIDGTLLLTRKAGVKAMCDAGRQLFGGHFTCEGVEFSGRLDPLIWRDLADRNGIEDHARNHSAFREAYRDHLRTRLSVSSTAYALPGVTQLIDELRATETITLGLLTGNYPETGEIKLHAAGLAPDAFAVRAWGIDGATRRDLPEVAMRRYFEKHDVAVPCESVIIIGDTPHDVDCARAHGCRALGVATGSFSAEALVECGADLVLADLAETASVVRWLLDGERSAARRG